MYYGVWYLLLTHHKEEIEHVLRFVHIALTHPDHTSDCERTFSVQNLTKTCLRSRLTDEHCSQIMHVIIECGRIEDIDFIMLWRIGEKKTARKNFAKKTVWEYCKSDITGLAVHHLVKGPVLSMQGDQRQGESGNFKVPFSNQGKSGKIDLFGENQGKIREFHYESGKKWGNFVVVFICYFLRISLENFVRAYGACIL